MADVETNVQVTPTITLPAQSSAGSEAIALALLKSSENQAASTVSLINALAPQREADSLAGPSKKSTDSTNLILLGLIVWLAMK